MKKIVAAVLMLILVLTFGLTGCGNDSSETSEDGDTYLIRIASDETMDTPCSESCLVFKDLVEKASDGKVAVEYYCNSAMGDEREIAESVNMGNLEMGIISAALLATYSSDWYVLDLPYAFVDGRDSMYKMLDGEMGDILKESLKGQSRIEAFDFADGGFKALMYAGDKPVTKVGDLSGMKFRCMENQMNMALYKSWNSTAVPMGMSEVYTALQQGTIDGVDTSPLYLVSNKLYEAADGFTLTSHQVLAMVSLANQDWFYNLPEEYQQIIRDASKEAWGVQERTMITEAETAACQTMRDFGLTEYELSDAEKQTFVDASATVYDEYVGTISDELMQMVAK